MRLTEKSCEDFTAALAAREPAPGGGGAAALAGALGLAAGEMAGRLSLGTAGVHEGELRQALARAAELRGAFLSLVERDVEAFAPALTVYAMPQGTPAEKARRDAALDAAMLRASEPALETMRNCCAALEAFGIFSARVNVQALSDAGTGLALCRAAFEGAAFNVQANARAMPDREKAQALLGEAGALRRRFDPQAAALLRSLDGRLAPGGGL